MEIVSNRCKGVGSVQQAIIVVSFGTKHIEQKRKYIDPCYEAIKTAYPDWLVYESFSSNVLRKRIKEEGISILGPDEILLALKRGGCERVIIQPLYMMAGREYNKLIRLKLTYAPYMHITVGKPLLSGPQDYLEIAEAIKKKYEGTNMQLLLLGVGSGVEANKQCAILEETIGKYLPGTLVVSVEKGTHINTLPLQCKELLVVPLMMGTGSCVIRDFLEEEKSVWRKNLEACGCLVQVETERLVEFAPLKEIFVRHIKEQL